MKLKQYAAPGFWILGIWLALIAACIFIISRAAFNADMSAFLPRSPTLLPCSC